MSQGVRAIQYSLTPQSSRRPSSDEAAADVEDLAQKIETFIGEAPRVAREPSGYVFLRVGPTTRTETELDEFHLLLEEEASRFGFKLIVETMVGGT